MIGCVSGLLEASLKKRGTAFRHRPMRPVRRYPSAALGDFPAHAVEQQPRAVERPGIGDRPDRIGVTGRQEACLPQVCRRGRLGGPSGQMAAAALSTFQG